MRLACSTYSQVTARARRGVLGPRRGVGVSGGDDLAMAAQAGCKALQRAVLVGAAAGDEERLDACLRRAQRVDVDAVVAPDHGAHRIGKIFLGTHGDCIPDDMNISHFYTCRDKIKH